MLLDGDDLHELATERRRGSAARSGCIAVGGDLRLARGDALPDAVAAAKRFSAAIRGALAVGGASV